MSSSQELQDMSPGAAAARSADEASTQDDIDTSAVVQQSLVDRVRNQVRYTLDNAPLLRFIRSGNRYNHLDPLGHPIGEGTEGVFSNMSAKPTLGNRVPSDQLPSYDEAADDPVPPYWESSIMAGYEDEIFIEGLPVANWLNFVWNLVVSVCFQFVGFLITYLLHTSHAAKNGSQAGLGLTLIQFGWSTIPLSQGSIAAKSGGGQRFEPELPSAVDVDGAMTMNGGLDGFESSLPSTTEAAEAAAAASDTPVPSTTYFSYMILVLGVFITVKACYDYWQVRRKEYKLTHQSTETATSSPV